MPELDWSDMPIHLAIKADRKTPEKLIEGSLGSAKTTIGLDTEIDALMDSPGIPTLLFRWSEDAVNTKLKPAFEEILFLRGIEKAWEPAQKRFIFANGSMAYFFGLKSVSEIEMFNKIRGLGVSRIFGDQVEEMRQEVAGELRGRLRPDLTATIMGKRFPFQLTFVANPNDSDFWLSKEFPEDNKVKGRKLYQLSIFDNKHLPQESKDSLLRQYPNEHPKNLTMVMGRRGPNITGVPVYDGLYNRHIHHVRAAGVRKGIPIIEAFEFGKHNPVWVFAQRMYGEGLTFLGGIRGTEMALEDFLPIVSNYRERWFPDRHEVLTCSSPPGSAIGTKFTALNILRKAGFNAVCRDHGNSPEVQLGLIETISGLLRRRTATGSEAVIVNDEPGRWLVVDKDGVKMPPFLHIAFEAGYTWDRHFVSVANKELRQPHDEDKFANVMRAVENLVLNFCANQLTQEERDATRRRDRAYADDQPFADIGPAGWMAL